MKLYEIIVNQLKQENNFVTDNGELKKWVVIGKARNYDHVLIRLLLENETLKEKFFVDVEGTLVFKQEEFITFMEMKNYFNDSYTRFKNKVGLTIGGKYLKQRNEVALVWPYKDCVLEGGQTKEEQKREEIFFNEILAQDEITQLLEPKVLTNAKVYDKNGAREFSGFTRDAELNGKRGLPKDTITDNLIIKGNNLLALHSLKKEFAGKVKLIYIDPPYNTKGDANTFLYNNSFNHSTWLTFIKNRLEVASKLMKDDGVIAIAIDDEEYAHLKLLSDDVFGRDNYMGTLIIQIKPSGRTTDAYLATCHEYVLFYSKIPKKPNINFFDLSEKERNKYTEGSGNNLFKWRDFLRTGGYSTPEERPNSYYPLYFNPRTQKISLKKNNNDDIEILPIDSNGKKRVWRKTAQSFLKHLHNNEIKVVKRKNGKYKVLIIDRIKSGKRPKSVWVESKYDASSYGTKLLKKLFNNEKIFDFPKSLFAVKDVISLYTTKNGTDIILDFFAGSGTTAHAVLELNKEDGGNRQFILVEQMDYIETVTVPRVKKVLEINDDKTTFTYFELKKYNQAFIEKIQKAETTEEMLAIWEQMKERSFLNYNIDIKKQEEHIEEFKRLSIEEQKKHLFEILDKNQLYVNLSSMNDANFKISEEEKRITEDFYQIKK